MTMFLAEIAFLLELALFAAGLVLWHKGREGTAVLLRGAGGVLVVGAALTALCTGYFSVRYQVQGEFDHACVVHPAMAAVHMMGPGSHGRPQSMGPCMLEPGMSEHGMQTMHHAGGAPAGEPSASLEGSESGPPEHAEHHP